MESKRNSLFIGFILLMGLPLLSSCGGGSISFRPTVYVHDYIRMDIVNAKGERIYCGQEKIQEYISVHQDDFAEMIFYLQNAKMPKKIKKKLLREFSKQQKIIKTIRKEL